MALFFVEKKIAIGHAGIRISKLLIVFELWHFFDFLGLFYEISQIFSKSLDFESLKWCVLDICQIWNRYLCEISLKVLKKSKKCHNSKTIRNFEILDSLLHMGVLAFPPSPSTLKFGLEKIKERPRYNAAKKPKLS